MQRVIVNVQNPRMVLHTGLKALFHLAQFEVILALIGIVMSIAGLSVSKSYHVTYYHDSNGAFGFGLFAAIVGLLSGALGMCALGGHGGVAAARIATVRHQRLAVAHFVMCILVAILDFNAFILFIVESSVWSGNGYNGIVAISSILTTSFLAHFVCSIISCGFTCNNWCCGGAGVQQRTEGLDTIYA